MKDKGDDGITCPKRSDDMTYTPYAKNRMCVRRNVKKYL